MIKTLTHKYRRIPNIGKLLLGMALFLGFFLASFKLIYAESIPFENNLSTMFSSWSGGFNTGYYSNTWFKYGGNNFVGIIFWQDIETLATPQPISINGGAQAIECTGHLRGIYYNNQRGRRIWPLDTGNLAILSGQGSGYETMTLTNGFYTSCTTVSGTYIPLSNQVYGQISHTFSGGQTFSMFAGISYDFTGNAISGGTSFANTLRINTGGVHAGYIFDTNGGIAELSMNVPWCQDFESIPSTQPIVISQGSGIALTCYGTNVSGYIINIFSGLTTIATNIIHTGVNSYTRTTGSTLATGDYIATCTVLGSDDTGPQCDNQITFHVGQTGTISSGTGCNPNFQGEISFLSYSGSIVIHPSIGTYYTNTTGITIQGAATEPTQYTVTGNFNGGIFTGIYTGNNIYDYISKNIILTNTNAWNNFSNMYVTGLCTYTDAAKRVYVDTTAPTTPSIITPINGVALCPSTGFNVTRATSYDSGAGLSYYKYEIFSNSGMITGHVSSGTLANTITGITLNTALLPLGTYYMRILAVDNLNNVTTSSPVSFTTSSQYCSSGAGIMIVTPTIWLRNVDLDKVYRSDPILILGLTGPSLISISKGMLFINNTTGGNGTTGSITSNDTIYIEMISSDTYDTTLSSQITILGLTGAFSLTTKKNNCSLSAAEKLIIQNIYAELKDQYNNDISKYSDFLNTFQSMVQDETDLSTSCTLDYLLSLIENDFGIDEGVDTSNHITPNCKEYSIGYDTNQKAYYAPEMINRYYFINRESLIRHLDYYNPGDCHINTYGKNFRTNDTSDSMKHTAPNGKIYHLIGQYGGFSATEFTSLKYFDSLQNIKTYIDIKNPAKEIWTHTVDTAFNPIVYAAPNGREYKIFKTDRGFMSYKLMKVKYYTTLPELKSYIDKNNPSKRK